MYTIPELLLFFPLFHNTPQPSTVVGVVYPRGSWYARTVPPKEQMATRAPPLCGLPGCQVPCYQRNGEFLGYCCKTHADQAKKGVVGAGVVRQPGICQVSHALWG